VRRAGKFSPRLYSKECFQKTRTVNQELVINARMPR
jgi:hypothetical protein